MSILDSDAMFAEVLARLRLAAQDDRHFDAAQMHLINLPEVIAEAGRDWPTLKDRIRAGTVSFLTGCLDEDDLVIPAGDGFLILFAQGVSAQLKARAEELRLVLLEFYVGQEGLKKLTVAASTRQIPAHELTAMFAPPPPPELDDLDVHEAMFAPVWSARANLVASYFCTPIRDTPNGPRFGYDKAYADTGQVEQRDYCGLDLALLDAVHEALAAQRDIELRPAIVASVHSTTMQNRRARAAFLERLAQIPEDMRKRLVVRVAEIEAGAPIIHLADWAGLLRARAPRVLLEFHASERSAPNLGAVGVWGAGYQALDHGELSAGGQARQFRRWSETLVQRRMTFFLGNLNTPELVRAAADAGAHFISSAVLWPPTPRPAGVIGAPAPFAASPSAA